LELKKFESLDRAVENVAKAVRLKTDKCIMPLLDALGMIAAEPVLSSIDLPPIPRSYVDGYAVRSEDTYGASVTNPIPLRLVEKPRIEPGECRKIFTGDYLPDDADAVVMFEDAEARSGFIYVYKSVPKYANVSLIGEDLRQGSTILNKHEVVRPWHLAALAANNMTMLEVLCPVKIGVANIGSELVEAGSDEDVERIYKSGKIPASTHLIVLGLLKRFKFIDVRYYGILPDDREVISRSIDRMLTENDVVITIGGSGPSDRDLTLDSIEDMGGRILVRGLRIRPGRPTSAAEVNGKLVFSLSGFPAAAFVGVEWFVLPVLFRLLNLNGFDDKIVVDGVLEERVTNVAGYTSFVRVVVTYRNGVRVVKPLALKGSGLLSTLLYSNGVLKIPEEVEGYEAGDTVQVHQLII